MPEETYWASFFAAGVVVDARELAAGERAAAIIMVADLADLRARGAVGALM